MLQISAEIEIFGHGTGKFVRVLSEESVLVTKLGSFRAERVSAAYRENACWMRIDNSGAVPRETQFLLMKDGGVYTALFALCDGAARTSLYAEGGVLYARTETYDENVPVGAACAVYIAEGRDPYRLIGSAYGEIRDALQSFELKYQKRMPKFVRRFGFCTYNAMSIDVTEENLIAMAELFRARGVPVSYMIIDDGWHSHDGNYLVSFDEDREKFPGGLEKVVSELKEEHGIEEVLCWHSYNGYWQGIKGDGFQGITAKEDFFTVPGHLAPPAQGEGEELNTAGRSFYPDNIFYEPCGFIESGFYEFYSAYYANLKKKGVDGTKIDAVAWVEGFSKGRGGRGKVMKDLVSGLENASGEIFGGELINCSSCSNDFFYNVHGVGVTRLSADYVPNAPEGCFNHFYSSAYVGMWTEPILFGDWDMFQSGAECGELHAKARAISGGPVYCSDSFDTVSEGIIRPLLSKNGYVAQCMGNAVPTEDCLFLGDGETLLKIFNRTAAGYVVGAFNCSPEEGRTEVVLGADIRDLPRGKYIVYSDERGLLGEYGEDGRIPLSLGAYRAEILTVVPVIGGAAVIGLKGKYNPSGFVCAVREEEAEVIDEGEYLVWERGSGLAVRECAGGKIAVKRGKNP